MTLALILILALGSANFFCHRALMESGDPLIREAVEPVVRLGGRYVTYAMEFVLFLLALALAERHPLAAMALYGGYSVINALTLAWVNQRRGGR